MGIVLPYYFLFSFFFLTDDWRHFLSFIPVPQWTLPVGGWTPALITSLSAIFIVLLLGLYYWQLTNKRMVIQIRKKLGTDADVIDHFTGHSLHFPSCRH